MCGRFTYRFTWKQLHRLMELTTWSDQDLQPRYNVAPTQTAPVVRPAADGGREGALLRWGLIPFWADDISIGNRMINARAETIASSGAFKHALKRRRCLVPVSGFYEWRKVPNSRHKRPYLIAPASGDILALAALWERWNSPDGPLDSFTIITTTPNDAIRPIHDRMPAILPSEAWSSWLSPETDPAAAQAMLGPCPSKRLALVPVSTRVNSPAHDDPSCFEPVETD